MSLSMQTAILEEPVKISEDYSDALLMERALAGDEQAFERIVSHYDTLLLNFAVRHVGDYERARDIVQHVWLQLYLFLPKLSADMPMFRSHLKDPLKSWLFKVTLNRCIQELRKKRMALFSELETMGETFSIVELIQDPGPLPEEVAERRVIVDEVRQAILRLPSRYRAIVMLRTLKELSFLEIGQVLHIPENTAKTYFHRALPKLLHELTITNGPGMTSASGRSVMP